MDGPKLDQRNVVRQRVVELHLGHLMNDPGS